MLMLSSSFLEITPILLFTGLINLVSTLPYIVILGEGAKNNPRGGRHFLYTTTGYICNSVIRSVGPSVQNLENKIKFKFSALVLDRDLGVSRGYQSDDKDEDEEDEEEVKDNKDDNEEAKEDDKEEDDDTITKL